MKIPAVRIAARETLLARRTGTTRLMWEKSHVAAERPADSLAR